MFEQQSFVVALAAVSLSVIAWPCLVVVRLMRVYRLWRKKNDASRRQRTRWALRFLVIALRYRVNPLTCYRLQFEQRSLSESEYLAYWSEPMILPVLRLLNDDRETKLLSDKKAFADYCSGEGIPVARECARVGPTSPLPPAFFERWKKDFILKPRMGSRSEGIERWLWSKGKYFQVSSGKRYRPSEMVARIDTARKRCDLLIQPYLRNHNYLEDLSNGDPIVFRILTVRVGGKIEVLAPIAQLPVESSQANAVHDRMYPVSVETDSGVLMDVLGRSAKQLGPTQRYPLTRAPILGRVVPNWLDGVALTKKAHSLFSGTILIGWDLVFTQEGPLILEGNTGCALVMHQLAPLGPLGETVLREAILTQI